MSPKHVNTCPVHVSVFINSVLRKEVSIYLSALRLNAYPFDVRILSVNVFIYHTLRSFFALYHKQLFVSVVNNRNYVSSLLLRIPGVHIYQPYALKYCPY